MARIRHLFLSTCLAACLYTTQAQGQGGSTTPAPANPAAKSNPAAAPARIDFYPGSAGSFNLPYDSAFTLGIHYKKGQLMYGATFVEIRGNETVQQAVANPSGRITLKAYLGKDTSDPVYNVEFRYPGKKSAGMIRPARRYALLITHDLISGIYSTSNDNGFLKDMYDYFSSTTNDSAGGYTRLEATYNSIKTRNTYSDSKGNKFLTMPDFSVVFTYYITSIYPKHKDYFTLLNQINTNTDVQNLVTFADLTAVAGCMTTLYGLIQAKGCSGKAAGGAACCDSICATLSTLQALLFLGANETFFTLLLKGQVSIGDILKNPADIKLASDPSGLQKNLHTTQDALTALQNALFRYGFETNNHCVDQLVNNLQTYGTQRAASISKLIKLKQDIYNLVVGTVQGSQVCFSGIDVDAFDTYTFNFQSRTALYLTPVFGYAVYKFGVTYDFSPYLGVQVNFEPLNQNVPFNQIQKKELWQRLSFVTAWTLKSVSYPGKRQDFFAGTSSLITGLGFKLSHVVMINGSALWFKALDPNPYSTQKNIVCVPSLSLSLNLTIKDLLNGFTSLIPSL
jgi:hypothetical protein